MRRTKLWIFLLVTLLLIAPRTGTVQSQPTAAKAWVMLPAAGDTKAQAFVVIENPSMYDVYLQSATSDAAGAVEFRDAAKADGLLKWVSVDAYGSLTMKPKGVYIQLVDLKKPLAEGDAVSINIVTDVNPKMTVSAVVRKESP